ncbi:MAG TPA: hypothetical protein VHX61_13305 [Rhizomicrobium sp.]|nr:hypothetical protein [Rhizomicrobium sp.]
MSLPTPHPGLVIRYSYLWRQEAATGREEGSKDRPCAIVMAITDEDGEQHVLVLPVTHSPPAKPADAVEIPSETKVRLRLDSDRSWIVITEANEFIWPGPDLRPIPGRDESAVAYGILPPRFFAHVRAKFLERDRLARSSRVKRTE